MINYLKQLKLEKKINSKLMKKYDVMTVFGDRKLIMQITAEGNCVKLYSYNEELFNILHDTQLPIDHGGRNCMEYKINKIFKNITRETIMSYLNFCESYKRK
jgi:imidazoleglycerol phosphate synthase glutamine amidotransferase subunit HisH